MLGINHTTQAQQLEPDNMNALDSPCIAAKDFNNSISDSAASLEDNTNGFIPELSKIETLYDEGRY